MDANALKLAIQDPTLAGLTDQQVQDTPGFGTPVLTPKKQPVTYVTLAAVWGASRQAQFIAGLTAAMASPDPNLSGFARATDINLRVGVDASNKDVPTVGAVFIAAGLATQTEFNAVFFDASFKAGSATVTADITTARASIARDAIAGALRTQVQNLAASFINEQLNVVQTTGGTLPTLADFKTLVNAAN